MLAQAAGLAVLAAISPTALLIAAAYLGADRPRLTASYYLFGAATVSVVMGVIFLIVLRNLGLSRPAEHAPRYGLRLGLGVLLIVAGLVVSKRRRRPVAPSQDRRGTLSRLVTHPGSGAAFAVGVLVFAPGATFIAAVQVIATARASIALTALAMAMIVVINVMLVWLPILLHVAAPATAERWLSAFNGWLRAHGRGVLAGALAIAGAVLAVQGTLGLVTG